MSRRCLGCMELFGDEFEICPHCGYIVGTRAQEAIHIEPGTLLYDRYIVGKALGSGGFGVTYIGWDGKLEQKVAIKEYLPGEFSTRMPGQSQVTVFNGEKSEQFYDGLKKFVEEARHLAKFQNEEGIVKIFDSFTENDTAYIIMEYLDGETLTSYLKREGTIPEDTAVAMLMPVMESLQAVHAEGLLHRDIAPDNIFLTKNGEVKLIDFGASRYATTSHSRSLTVIIKPGYSPEEQYRSRGDQGPYTDVYAMAATLYKMITGKTPPDAMERRAKYENQNKDILEEPHKINKNISLQRENAILNALNVRIEDRTPDMPSFIQELNADPPVKRRYGKIKKIDIYSWPLWVKILVPSLLSVILVFGALLLTGVIKFSNFTEDIVIPDYIVTVPDVEGLQKEEALKLITEGKLLASTDGSVESEYIPAGMIILQTPTGGTYMDVNGTVHLMLSSGKGVESPENGLSTVPYVIWDSVESAVAKLMQAGLGKPEIIEANDDYVAYGSIIAQSIEAGTQVDEGTSITLTVSIGPAAFDMPDVSGKESSAAEAELIALGLRVSKEYEKNNVVQENYVIRQEVDPGAKVKAGDTVVLVISTGKETVEVANVVGRTQQAAVSELEAQGFKVTISENYDTNVPAGNVISQMPEAGTVQTKGTEVMLYVSKGKRLVNVKLDANEGTVSKDSVTLEVGFTYGDLPSASREGYSFMGWYTSKTGGTRIHSSTAVTNTSAHTLYAHWTNNGYTVTFDVNGGDKLSPGSIIVEYDTAYGSMPTPKRTGYSFIGWYTARTGGNPVNTGTKMTTASNHTLYAHWTANTYMVMFDACGGTASEQTKYVTYEGTYGKLPTAERKGYTFGGWYTSASGGVQITENTKMTESRTVTLYAHWTANTYTVKFDPNGGTVTPTSKTVKYNDVYGTLPKPVRSGHTFDGWYTSQNGGSRVTESMSYQLNSDQTLYAHWTAITYTVVFNLNASEGKVDYSSKTVTEGSSYGSLPSAKRDYYRFTGWYTAASGGTYVSSTTVVPSNSGSTINLYAHWEENALSGWVTKDEVPSDAKIVNTKTQYRYRDRTKETTVSSSKSLSGWIQYGSPIYGEWGKWSAWQPGSKKSDDTTDVQTATVYGYYYFVCPRCGAHMHYWGDVCYGWMGGCGSAIIPESSWTAVWLTTPWSAAQDPYGTGKKLINSSEYGRVFCWTDSGQAQTGYRFRTRTVSYRYYRWSDYGAWSSWSDSQYTSSESRQVETRTLYQYRKK